MAIAVRADSPAEQPDWLLRNYGPRCTLVCAVSVLRLLGASAEGMVPVLERATGYLESYGPRITAYLGGHSQLDRGIEAAARLSGLRVASRTRFFFPWRSLKQSLDTGVPIVLNCFRAPSRRWSHSVLATAYKEFPRRLLTLDPNDGVSRWMRWNDPASGWICTATFISPHAHRLSD
jgi:hypothetical protein